MTAATWLEVWRIEGNDLVGFVGKDDEEHWYWRVERDGEVYRRGYQPASETLAMTDCRLWMGLDVARWERVQRELPLPVVQQPQMDLFGKVGA